MARLPDPRPHLDADGRAAYERMLERRRTHGVGLYGPYVPLLHDPPVAERIEQLGGWLKFESALPRPVFQFVVLTVARLTGAEFEWRDHEAHARAAGLPAAVIDALAGLPTGAPGAAATLDALAGLDLPEPYAAVAPVLAAAFGYRNIPDDVQAGAVAALGEGGLVEVVVLTGFYGLVAMVNAGFDVPLDEAGH